MKPIQVVLVATMIALPGSVASRDDRDQWPEGSARHALVLEAAREDALRATLEAAHRRLLDAFGDSPDDPSPLAHAVAVQHQAWLAYRVSDCRLAGMLSGAGGAWPHVHGLACSNDAIEQRIKLLDATTSCLRTLPAERYPSDEQACLQPLADWSPGEP